MADSWAWNAVGVMEMKMDDTSAVSMGYTPAAWKAELLVWIEAELLDECTVREMVAQKGTSMVPYLAKYKVALMG